MPRSILIGLAICALLTGVYFAANAFREQDPGVHVAWGLKRITLPRGSMIIESPLDPIKPGKLTEVVIPGKVGHWSLFFTNSNGWDYVSTHIRKCALRERMVPNDMGTGDYHALEYLSTDNRWKVVLLQFPLEPGVEAKYMMSIEHQDNPGSSPDTNRTELNELKDLPPELTDD